MNPTTVLRLAEIEAARSHLAGGIRRTHLGRMMISELRGGPEVWLKRDDLQRTRSFKERGALHALLRLDDRQRARGVVAASAGNHGLGLAYHGARLGLRVTIVVPVTASDVKVSRCRGLGAEVVLAGAVYAEAQAHAAGLAQESGRVLVHPFDDPDVIAGQGTMALEILEDLAQFDTLVLPVGGGGLLAGCAVAVKAVRPAVRVVAVQPENSPSFAAARRGGRPVPTAVRPSLADGLAVSTTGNRCFEWAAPLVDAVVTVSEEEIAAAVSVLARKAGIVAEGAGATAFAALLAGKVPTAKAVAPITGGNITPRLHEQTVADGNRPPSLQAKAA